MNDFVDDSVAEDIAVMVVDHNTETLSTQSSSGKFIEKIVVDFDIIPSIEVLDFMNSGVKKDLVWQNLWGMLIVKTRDSITKDELNSQKQASLHELTAERFDQCLSSMPLVSEYSDGVFQYFPSIWPKAENGWPQEFLDWLDKKKLPQKELLANKEVVDLSKTVEEIPIKKGGRKKGPKSSLLDDGLAKSSELKDSTDEICSKEGEENPELITSANVTRAIELRRYFGKKIWDYANEYKKVCTLDFLVLWRDAQKQTNKSGVSASKSASLLAIRKHLYPYDCTSRAVNNAKKQLGRKPDSETLDKLTKELCLQYLAEGMPKSFYPREWLVFVVQGPPSGDRCLQSLNGGQPLSKIDPLGKTAAQVLADSTNPSIMALLNQTSNKSGRRAAREGLKHGSGISIGSPVGAFENSSTDIGSGKKRDFKATVEHIHRREADAPKDPLDLLIAVTQSRANNTREAIKEAKDRRDDEALAGLQDKLNSLTKKLDEFLEDKAEILESELLDYVRSKKNKA